MKLLFFDDFRLGVVKGDRVVDVSVVVNGILHIEPQQLINGLIENFEDYRQKLEDYVASSDGIPLTFSRRLLGIVRSSNLSGPLRSDLALLLSCQELDLSNPMPDLQPFVARMFCDDAMGTPSGRLEIFSPTTFAQQGALRPTQISGGGSLPTSLLRIQMDGGLKPENSARVRSAGCDVLVAASAIFGLPRGDWSRVVADLRGL